MKYHISINVEGVSEEIEKQLLCSLRSQQDQSVNQSFNLSVELDQCLIGGITAETSYGWVLIKTLWVKDGYRRCGIGSKLLNEAEGISIENDCHGSWLDTSSRKAREFYLRHGYRDFGILGNRPGQQPSMHRRWFMQKIYRLPATPEV